MWHKLKENKNCKRFRDGLEEAAAKLEGATRVESLIALLPEELRGHAAACADCREAANDVVQVRALFNGAGSFTDEERPWFAARVMAAITSRERNLGQRVSAWAYFPRFASRLAWVAAILLLAGTTWFYESVLRAPAYTSSGSQETIFEGPQTTPDDTLVSRASDNP